MELYDLITPAELTGYARAALADRAENQFQLTRWLPHRQVDDLVYRFNRGGGGLVEAADYRAYDAEPGFGRREGFTRVTGELPPIARQYILGEYDQLRLRNADQQIRDALLRDAARLAREIDARFEIARGQALVEGKVTLNEKGVVAEVDFGRDASMSVSAGTVWSDHTNADVLDDLLAWIEAYVSLNGVRPGAMLMGRTVASHIFRNSQVRAQLYPNNAERRLTPGDVNNFLAEFDIPPITIFDAQVKRNGSATRIIPADKVLLLPASGSSGGEDGDLGATLWGTTAEAQLPEYGIGEGDHPGLVVASFLEKKTPVRVETIGSAIGIPVLANPNLAMVADVLA